MPGSDSWSSLTNSTRKKKALKVRSSPLTSKSPTKRIRVKTMPLSLRHPNPLLNPPNPPLAHRLLQVPSARRLPRPASLVLPRRLEGNQEWMSSTRWRLSLCLGRCLRTGNGNDRMLIRSIVGSSFMIVLYAFIGFNVCICTAALTISKMPKEKGKYCSFTCCIRHKHNKHILFRLSEPKIKKQ